MNKVVLIGRLAKDPELRSTPSNQSVCQFTMAVDRRFKSENQPTADFIPVVAWNKTGEFVSKYFVKGNKIALTGSIQTRSWDDQEGKRHYVTEVIADEVEFVESKKSDNTGNSSNSRNTATSNEFGSQSQAGGFFVLDEDDGDIPF